MSVHSDLRHAKEAIVRMAEMQAPALPQGSARAPYPLEAPPVRVVAITASWCVGGQPVTPGETYTVSRGDADRLVHVGKARYS